MDSSKKPYFKPNKRFCTKNTYFEQETLTNDLQRPKIFYINHSRLPANVVLKKRLKSEVLKVLPSAKASNMTSNLSPDSTIIYNCPSLEALNTQVTQPIPEVFSNLTCEVSNDTNIKDTIEDQGLHDAEGINEISQQPNETGDPNFIQNQQEPQTLNNISETLDSKILKTMNQILENQIKMQAQINYVEQCLTGKKEYPLAAMTRENLVYSKQSFKSIRRLFGENLSPLEEEMGSLLPVADSRALEELENKISDQSQEDALRSFLMSKRGNQTIDTILRRTVGDNCLSEYNWDGRRGKKSFRDCKLVSKILAEVFTDVDQKRFEEQVRRSIELAHNRYKQKQYKDKKLSHAVL